MSSYIDIFDQAFSSLAWDPGERGTKARRAEWKQVTRSRTQVSFSECIAWVKRRLLHHCKIKGFADPANLASVVWKAFRPSCNRAFNSAKGTSKPTSPKRLRANAFVTFQRFRALCGLLIL